MTTYHDILKDRADMLRDLASGELFAWFERTKPLAVKEVVPR